MTLSRHSNVLILTTSNITGVIDLAFLDRADVRQYIGLPSAAAVYQILHSCIQELIRVCCVLSVMLRAKLSDAVYYYRSCLWRAGGVCVCLFVGLLPR